MYSLFPVNREQEIYQVEKLEATREQVKYSPIDKVSESAEGVIVHSIDAAVICLEIKEEISFETTDYVIGEHQCKNMVVHITQQFHFRRKENFNGTENDDIF